MSYLSKSNLAYATVAVAPSPALSGTSITVAAGKGSLFPASNFTITVYPPNTPPLASNAEICLCTSRTGDVLTIVRAQEGTTAKSIATGWQLANTATALDFTEIQDSIIQFISAGTTKASASEVVFSNSNGVTFGVNGQTITASVATGAGGGGVAISAAGSSQDTGTIVFSNSNNVSFGMNGSTVTASVTAVQSTQPVAASASNGSFLFSTLGFSNANGVTFGTSAGSIVTASIAASAVPGVVFSANTASSNLTKVVFSNSNNVTFGLNGSVITASIFQSVIPIAAGSQQGTAGVSFVNSNGITFGMSNSSEITASFNGLTSQSNQAASASNGSFAFQTLGFSNANNVTFGTSAGSIITASVGAGTQSTQPVAASASNGSFLFSTLGFSNGNGVTFGTSAGSIITASVAAGAAASITFSAGASSAALNSVVFSNSNGVSFGLNGSTVTASIAAAGGAINFAEFEPQPAWTNGGFLALFSSSNTYIGDAFALPGNISNKYARMLFNFTMTASNIATLNSGSATGSYGETGTFQAMFYSSGTGASAGSLMLISSNTCSTCHVVSFSMTNSTQYTISHLFSIPQEGVQSTFSTSRAFSTNSYVNSTSNVSNFVGVRFLDFDLTASLTGGNYVFMAGQYSSDSSRAGAITDIAGFKLRQNSVFVNQLSFQQSPYFGAAGAQTKAFNGLLWIITGATTDQIDFGQLSNNGKFPYYSLHT